MLGMYTPLVVIGVWTKSASTTPRYASYTTMYSLLSTQKLMLILSFIMYRLLALISIFYTVGLSFFSPHLEIRFLLPALPFLHLLCGPVLQDMIQYGWSTDAAQNRYIYKVLLCSYNVVNSCEHCLLFLYLVADACCKYSF